MNYYFDEPVDRQGTSCVKYDLRKDYFGNADLIPMWVADMDFKTPPFIMNAIKERLQHEILGYTVRRKEYFSSIVKWVGRRYNWNIQPSWISFSPGIVPALNLSTLAYTKPGDKIIIQPPVYFPFFNAVTDHGREIVYNQLLETDDGRWLFDLDDLERKAAKGAKMLILSNPHNPVGRAWTAKELKSLAEICLKHNVLIISDEIHSDLVLPAYKHTPLASLSKEVSDITLTCMAPSKTFNLAGMSTSSMIIEKEDLRNRFNRQIEIMHISGGNIFGTEASIAAYTHGDKWLEQLLVYIQGNIDYLVNRLKSTNIPVKPVIPEATYMLWLDCRETGIETEKLGEFFINKANTGMNEGAMFGPGGEGFMRINLACPRNTVSLVLDNFETAFSNNK